jgi:hypothetical protein
VFYDLISKKGAWKKAGAQKRTEILIKDQEKVVKLTCSKWIQVDATTLKPCLSLTAPYLVQNSWWEAHPHAQSPHQGHHLCRVHSW